VEEVDLSSEPPCLAEVFLPQSPGCHWMVDAEGIFARFYGDPAPLFGKTSAELSGRAYAEALESELAESWGSRFKRVFAGETLVLRDRQGERAWSIFLFPVRLEGAIRYAGGSAREVTSWTAAEQELRYTVLGALRAQEHQSSAVSKFLHDSVGQNLTALGLQLDLVRMDLEGEHAAIAEQVAAAQKLLDTVVEQVREYSYELNPSTVERAGLRPALDRLRARIHQRYTGSLRINVNPSLKIDAKSAAALYRVAQEAVDNAVQHSSCSSIEIAVKSTRKGPLLEVRDNGRGFDPGDLRQGSRGLGLMTMEHFAAQAGMDLSVKSSVGSGTVVILAPPQGRARGEL
jgi:two-component sensor histidine kinase